MSVQITRISVEHHHDGFGISVPAPRLSWSFGPTAVKGWQQASYEIKIVRGRKTEQYEIASSEQCLVPWPSTNLTSREIAVIDVRAMGQDGWKTEWATITVEAALLDRAEWKAQLIGGPRQEVNQPKQPVRVRKTFSCQTGRSRLYATAHGIYHVEINGIHVGDQCLAPGWQSYEHHLNYQVYDVTDLLKEGENVIGAYVGEGWFAGRLGRPGVSNIWGDRLGFLCQLEIDGKAVCVTNGSWEYLYGPVEKSELYNGEIFDTTQDRPWTTDTKSNTALGSAEELPFPSAELIAPDVAPVKRIMEICAEKIITTPSGKTILDFGQNLVGWLRINVDIPGSGELLIKHAEVLEHGELGTRPLRTAKAQVLIKLGGKGTEGFEPNFTFYGFRYAEINGIKNLKLSDFTAIVISSNMRPTGSFECSHALISKLHQNTVWSMRGNFVSVPTDCPQRDERLGWTGDLQVFAPTANYLYDTAAFLNGWLKDLDAEQKSLDGVVPTVVPKIPIPPRFPELRRMAVWGDCVVITPWDLYQTFGDKKILESQWEGMCQWLERGIPRGPDELYDRNITQYGDWLDPRSPPHLPGHSPTDANLIANAYLVFVTELAAKVARILEKPEATERYTRQAASIRNLFRAEYITPNGRLASDTQAAYVVALHFGLFDSDKELKTATERLDWLTRWEAFKITTGFAGTPLILGVLAENDMLSNAYRMLQERDSPSWLYPVSMGATTIWERWNSMLPDGTINPGQMTSFNHYALGSVCSFLHKTVGGLSAGSPGWKSALFQPRPGGTIEDAKTSFDSPIGTYSISWKREGSKMKTSVKVPPNGEARVVLNGLDETVKSGEYEYETDWVEDPRWPPIALQGLQAQEEPSHFVA
ncbi:bacterial alpha-L-rhamnosidase domain-containing protein [Trichoderma compactum]